MSEREEFDPVTVIAACVRKSAEYQFPRSKTLRNRCMITSFALSFLFRGAGIPSTVMQGYFWRTGYRNRKRKGASPHCWVQTATKIYDLTLTQFVRSADIVTVLPANDDRYEQIVPLTEDGIREHLWRIGMDEPLRAIALRAVQLIGDLQASLEAA